MEVCVLVGVPVPTCCSSISPVAESMTAPEKASVITSAKIGGGAVRAPVNAEARRAVSGPLKLTDYSMC